MNKITHWFIIGTFVLLYFIVSIISTIHVIDFFRLSNPNWLAIALAIAFEIGAAASLASIIILKKTSKVLVWSLFIILTLVQAMGNTYYAFSNLENYQSWVELFGLIEEEEIAQKRILSIISGAILPLVALGFIKSLVDYIKPEDDKNLEDEKRTQNDIKEVETEIASRDAVGDMEKEVDRLLPYKDETEREVIKEKIKSKMLELVNKEKDNIVPEKKINTDLNTLDNSINKKESDTIISESDKVKEEDTKKELQEPREPHDETIMKKPLNKKRPFKKNETHSGYKGGI